MMGSRWFEIYSCLPIWVQNISCSLAGIWMRRQRYNKVFRSALEFLERSQWWSEAEQASYQDEQLRILIRHAYETVPYYNEMFRRLKLTPDDVRTVSDLPKLPILSKSIVRKKYHDLQSRGWPRNRRVYGHTGGTTGTALKLVADKDTLPWQWAVWWRHRKRFGLKVGEPHIVFAGRPVVPLRSMSPPIWRRNIFLHQTYVSVHHLTKQNMPALAEYLKKRSVAYYSGYPSGLYLVAKYFLDNHLRLSKPPRVIVTGAETLLPHQRKAISKAFDTQVVEQWGSSEQCGNISECELHSYHVDFEFGIVEFVGSPDLPENSKRIICTSLRNPVMPLIRYEIGDIARISDQPCKCGRASKTVLSIDGRIESYIVTPDGRRLGRLDFLFKKTHNIEEAQLVQETLGHVIVKIVRSSRYNKGDEIQLLENFRTYLGRNIRISIEYIDEIPRESNGKFRQIVSKVANMI